MSENRRFSLYSEEELKEALKKEGDRGEAARLLKPIAANPADCETYEKIVWGNGATQVMKEKGTRWAVSFMHFINLIHNRHNNPQLHKGKPPGK